MVESGTNETFQHAHVPNVIGNDESCAGIQRDPSARPHPMEDVQPQYQEDLRPTRHMKVNTNTLQHFIKSKKDLYTILCLEGQYHLPAMDECTMEFMRDCLSGRKKLIKYSAIRNVNLPKFEEFNCSYLYGLARTDEVLSRHLPDPTEKNPVPVQRRFLLNVSLPLGFADPPLPAQPQINPCRSSRRSNPTSCRSCWTRASRSATRRTWRSTTACLT